MSLTSRLHLTKGHAWSRSRRQREVWSRFLPSPWSSFGGALWPAGWHETDRKVVNFPRQVTASPGAISHSPGRSNADETLAGGTGSRAAAGSPQGGDTSETGGRRRHGPGVWRWESPIPSAAVGAGRRSYFLCRLRLRGLRLGCRVRHGLPQRGGRCCHSQRHHQGRLPAQWGDYKESPVNQ